MIYRSCNVHEFKNSRWGILGECTAVCTTVRHGCCSRVLRSHGPNSRSASEKLPRVSEVRLLTTTATTRVRLYLMISCSTGRSDSEKVGFCKSWVAKALHGAQSRSKFLGMYKRMDMWDMFRKYWSKLHSDCKVKGGLESKSRVGKW